MTDTQKTQDTIDSEENKKWGNVLRACLLLVVTVGCGVGVNLSMANSPSTDDAIRGIVLTIIGATGKHVADLITSILKTSA